MLDIIKTKKALDNYIDLKACIHKNIHEQQKGSFILTGMKHTFPSKEEKPNLPS